MPKLDAKFDKGSESSREKLLLIDGHSMAYRAFYALPVDSFVTSQGQHTNAIYGFTSMILNLIKEVSPTHVAVAFDVSRKTFRSEKFPDYKAQRAKTPDEFRSQMPIIQEIISAMGMKHFSIEGFEADDIIATFATQAEKAGMVVDICTGDRDAFQLITDNITVLYPKKGVTEMTHMTPSALFEKYGLTPGQYHDFAALRGDPSDNLPSIPGVGEKTATKWIQEYGDIKTLVAKVDEIGGKVGDALRAHLSSVILNHELTELQRNVTLGSSLTDLTWKGFASEDLIHILERLEIKALTTRIKTLGSSEKAAVVGKSVSVENKSATSAEVDALLAWVSEPVSVFIDIENGKVRGYSVSLDGVTSHSVLGENPGEWLSQKHIRKYMHGFKDAARYLEIEGVEFDTEIAAYLLNPGSRNLDAPSLLQRYLDITLEQPSDDLFSSFDGSIAAHIARLAPILRREIEQVGMGELLTELELPTAKLLAKMEATGIALDSQRLDALAQYFQSEVSKETESAYQHAGKEFNVASPKQLQGVLFDDLKLPKTKKIKTGYSTDAESLDFLYEKSKHPLLKNLLRIREAGKLLTTIEGLRAAIDRDGRIHTTFQQTTTATGRLSSIEPNLQNIPVRTEEGRRIRECFVASKGYSNLLTADYSQIEMRIMAHLSVDKGLIEAFNSGEDLHNTVASLVFGVRSSDVSPEMRRQIKAMSYGLAYGLSAYGLSQQLGLSPSEAQVLMGNYFQRFGGIRDFLHRIVEEARKNGYTSTVIGRRRYLPDLNSDNRQAREAAERMALNAPIQGSAADIIKQAMLNVDRLIVDNKLQSRLLLQVHDELIFEVAPGEEEVLEKFVREGMGSAAKLTVPLEVNVGLGHSWDEAAH